LVLLALLTFLNAQKHYLGTKITFSLKEHPAHPRSEILLTFEHTDPVELFGENHVRFQLLKDAFPAVNLTARGNTLKISGEKKVAQRAKDKVEGMVRLLREHSQLTNQMVEDLLMDRNPFEHILTSSDDNRTILHSRDGRPIRAKTRNQRALVDSCERNDIVFAIGPAGTGKTYTAVALAVRALKNKTVRKIILTRPAVEAGESLGFLPGDLKEKVDPYLRPLYDALDDMIPAEKLQQFMTTRVIEIAPLAFMRGRTLDQSFIILDEAQNCTSMQLKMFLTRLGPTAKCIITGDLSQIDLPFHSRSGLRKAIEILGHLDGVGTVHLNADDVVRHRLVREIILAYDRLEEENRRKKSSSALPETSAGENIGTHDLESPLPG